MAVILNRDQGIGFVQLLHNSANVSCLPLTDNEQTVEIEFLCSVFLSYNCR